MAKIWVQAVTNVPYDKGGTIEVAGPGDWFEVGKHQARKLMGQGKITIPKESRRKEVMDYSGCGVLVRGDESPGFEGLQAVKGAPSLPFEYTILWKPPSAIRLAVVEAGLVLLQGGGGWEMLAMVVDENARATDVGSAEERRKTEAVVGDLRIPVYDTQLLWVRKTQATLSLVGAWAKELGEGADEQHAFLRALYSSRVMLYTLPPRWQGLHG